MRRATKPLGTGDQRRANAVLLGQMPVRGRTGASLFGGFVLGVPAYGYPGTGVWEQLTMLPPRSFVILDPADGPGRAVDPTYVRALAPLAGRGISVLGYVDTDYGRRPAVEMADEIRRYRQWYHPTGIFLDQTPAGASGSEAIRTIVADLRSQQLELVINPGQPDIEPDDAALADCIVNFEGPLAVYRRTRFPAWTRALEPTKFWHLVYEVGDPATMLEVAAMARRRNAGVLHVTDATMPNPWQRLPAYWDAERDAASGGAGDGGFRT